MKIRLALTGLLAAVVAAVVAPSPSFAAGNNNNATIDGVSSVPVEQSTGCGWGEFCMWTKPNRQGRIFRMPRCDTYAMQNWNGYGSWQNNNTGGAYAYLKNSSGRIVLTTSPLRNYYDGNYDFTPIWFVTPC